MPGDPSPKASPGGIIAYNCDSNRGWNDPPTFAFSTNKATNKPKLDLRKRVSHQQALAVRQTAPSAQNTFNLNHEVTSAVGNLNLNGTAPPTFTPSPVTSAPGFSNAIVPPGIPSSFFRNVSAPSFANGNASGMKQSPMNAAHSTDLTSLQASSVEHPSGTLIGQPLFDLKSHSYDPVQTAPLHSIRSTAEIGDHYDDHHNHHSSPQIFHPVTTPSLTGNLLTQPCTPPLHASPQIFHPITPPVTSTKAAPTYQDGSNLPQPVVPLEHVTPPPPIPFQSPVGHVTPPLYAATGHPYTPPAMSTPVISKSPQLPAGHLTPPPDPSNHVTLPTSLSAGSTPRSSSPSNRDMDNCDASLMSDEDGLRVTMDALQDVINKLQDSLEKRVADDISRRLQLMSQSWKDGKLSNGVKSRMIKLAKALDSGDANEAHHIHVSLMVDFVAEVKQWMVAVKKLISLVSSSNTFSTQS